MAELAKPNVSGRRPEGTNMHVSSTIPDLKASLLASITHLVNEFPIGESLAGESQPSNSMFPSWDRS